MELLSKNSSERYELCKSCVHFNATLKTCKLCGCFLPAKTKLKGSQCPLKKW